LSQRASTILEPEDILNEVKGAKFFSKIDLTNAFLQLPISDNSKQLVTINTPYGLFRYNFLPFGLSVSPSIFQEEIDKIVSGLVGVKAYQDDLIVWGNSKADHDTNLISLLKVLGKFNVQINAQKSVFSSSEISFLGYLVDSDGYRPDPTRLDSVMKAPMPTSHTELRSFLGMLQYYSRFVPNFSARAQILFELQSSDVFKWLPVHTKCLEQLRNEIAKPNILRPYSSKLMSIVYTDASPHGIGAVLEQEGAPVICVSRRLTKAEQGYAQTQREALAVVWAVQRLRKFLTGVKFRIVTDHQALKFVFDSNSSLAKSSSAMVQRWAISLSCYQYDIVHREGKQIPHADFLSRHSYFQKTTEDDEITSFLCSPLPISRGKLVEETRKY